MEVRKERITVVDTKGHCFLCLGQIPSELTREASSVGLTSTPVNGRCRLGIKSRRSTGRPATSGSGSELPSSTYSVLGLSRYLGVDLRRVFAEENGGAAMARTGRSMISSVVKKVTLCGGCAPLGERFSEMYGQLEVIEMQVMACLKLIHQRLAMTEEGEKGVEVKRKFVKKFRGKGRVPDEQGLEEQQLGIVEELRKETFEKCSQKLRTFPPRVLILRAGQQEPHIPPHSPSKVGMDMISDVGDVEVKTEPPDEDFISEEGATGIPDYEDDTSSSPSRGRKKKESKTGEVSEGEVEAEPPPGCDDDQSDEEWELPRVKRRAKTKARHLNLTMKRNRGRQPRTGKSKPNVRSKSWTINLETRQYQCLICSEQFPTIQIFHDHYNSSHLKSGTTSGEDIQSKSETRKSTCPACGKEFGNRSVLGRHFRENCPMRKKLTLDDEDDDAQQKDNNVSEIKTEAITEEGGYGSDPVADPATPNQILGGNLGEPGGVPNQDQATAEKEAADKLKVVSMILNKKPRKHPVRINPIKYTVSGKRKPRRNDYILDRRTGIFRCKVCSEEFPKYMKFFQHRKTVHEKDATTSQCQYCGKEFAQLWSLTAHINQFHRGITFDCSECGKSFKQKSLLQRHCRLMGCAMKFQSPTRHPCHLCGKVFRVKEYLRQHLVGVHKRREGEEEEGTGMSGDLKIKDCPNPNTSQSAMSSEPEGEETGPGEPVDVGGRGHSELDVVVLDDTVGKYSYEEVYPPEIPEEYKRIPYEDADPATGKWNCTLCPMEFAAAINFRNHYKGIHLKVRYKCDLCDKQFSYVASIYRHHQQEHQKFRIHCPVCKFQFKQKCDLKKHLRRTSCGVGKVPKPKKASCFCHICGKGMTKEFSLRMHLEQIHGNGNVRDQLCDICGKGFKQRAGLKRHRETMHPESVVTVAKKRKKKDKPEGEKDI